MDKSSVFIYHAPMHRALFYLQAWWPLYLASIIFAAFTLWLLAPVDLLLAIASAPLMAVAGWFSMALVLVAADYSGLA